MDIVTGLGVGAVNERTLVNGAKLSGYGACTDGFILSVESGRSA
jgi:hypothetical protein